MTRLIPILAAAGILLAVGTARAVTCTSDFASPLAVQSIRDVQTKLAERGYRPGAADGKIGPRTCQAVLAFQKDAGVTRDGVLNQALQQRLHFGATPARRHR
jgi:peptidoglycan hydrolase-like protein with peptidoglycan-binding domain